MLAGSGEGVMWVAFRGPRCIGVGVAKIARRAAAPPACLILGVAGVDWSSWGREMHAQAEKWAVSQGATVMQFTGRKAWARRMKDYAETAAVFEKELG